MNLENKMLERIAEMIASNEPEMIELGMQLLFMNNPTEEEIIYFNSLGHDKKLEIGKAGVHIRYVKLYIPGKYEYNPDSLISKSHIEADIF